MKQMPGGLPGGMLAVGIDSHISSQTYQFDLQRRSKTDKIKQEFLLPSFKNSRGGVLWGKKDRDDRRKSWKTTLKNTKP